MKLCKSHFEFTEGFKVTVDAIGPHPRYEACISLGGVDLWERTESTEDYIGDIEDFAHSTLRGFAETLEASLTELFAQGYTSLDGRPPRR